jgi:hypothetical protein
VSAEIISYSATDYDTRLSLKLECLTCGIEWGWTADTKGVMRWLQNMADMHNAEHHQEPKP